MTLNRIVVIILSCVLLLTSLVAMNYATYHRGRAIGYSEGYDAALKVRDWELEQQRAYCKQEMSQQAEVWVRQSGLVAEQCLKWKPKQRVVMLDPLTMQ